MRSFSGTPTAFLPLSISSFLLPFGLLPLRTAGLEPLCVERTRGRDRVDLEGKHVKGKREEVLAAVVVPGAELLLVGGGALQRETPLHFLHLQVDADLLPLLPDPLRGLRVPR